MATTPQGTKRKRGGGADLGPTRATRSAAGVASTSSTGGGGGGQDVVRCICGATTDDGTGMIECDGCKAWQHLDCVFGPHHSAVAAGHVQHGWRCERCNPRPPHIVQQQITAARARRGMDLGPADEYVALQDDDTLMLPVSLDEFTPTTSFPALPADGSGFDVRKAPSKSAYTPIRYSLVATRKFLPGEPIVQYISVVAAAHDYLRDSANQYTSIRLPKPYVHLLKTPNGSILSLDSRQAGNVSRWARSSCHPNAEIQMVLVSSSTVFAIVATAPINDGDEITLPWEWDDTHFVQVVFTSDYPRTVEPPRDAPIAAVVLRDQENSLHECACRTDDCVWVCLAQIKRGEWPSPDRVHFAVSKRGIGIKTNNSAFRPEFESDDWTSVVRKPDSTSAPPVSKGRGSGRGRGGFRGRGANAHASSSKARTWSASSSAAPNTQPQPPPPPAIPVNANPAWWTGPISATLSAAPATPAQEAAPGKLSWPPPNPNPNPHTQQQGNKTDGKVNLWLVPEDDDDEANLPLHLRRKWRQKAFDNVNGVGTYAHRNELFSYVPLGGWTRRDFGLVDNAAPAVREEEVTLPTMAQVLSPAFPPTSPPPAAVPPATLSPAFPEVPLPSGGEPDPAPTSTSTRDANRDPPVQLGLGAAPTADEMDIDPASSSVVNARPVPPTLQLPDAAPLSGAPMSTTPMESPKMSLKFQDWLQRKKAKPSGAESVSPVVEKRTVSEDVVMEGQEQEQESREDDNQADGREADEEPGQSALQDEGYTVPFPNRSDDVRTPPRHPGWPTTPPPITHERFPTPSAVAEDRSLDAPRTPPEHPDWQRSPRAANTNERFPTPFAAEEPRFTTPPSTYGPPIAAFYHPGPPERIRVKSEDSAAAPPPPAVDEGEVEVEAGEVRTPEESVASSPRRQQHGYYHRGGRGWVNRGQYQRGRGRGRGFSHNANFHRNASGPAASGGGSGGGNMGAIGGGGGYENNYRPTTTTTTEKNHRENNYRPLENNYRPTEEPERDSLKQRIGERDRERERGRSSSLSQIARDDYAPPAGYQQQQSDYGAAPGYYARSSSPGGRAQQRFGGRSPEAEHGGRRDVYASPARWEDRGREGRPQEQQYRQPAPAQPVQHAYERYPPELRQQQYDREREREKPHQHPQQQQRGRAASYDAAEYNQRQERPLYNRQAFAYEQRERDDPHPMQYDQREYQQPPQQQRQAYERGRSPGYDSGRQASPPPQQSSYGARRSPVASQQQAYAQQRVRSGAFDPVRDRESYDQRYPFSPPPQQQSQHHQQPQQQMYERVDHRHASGSRPSVKLNEFQRKQDEDEMAKEPYRRPLREPGSIDEQWGTPADMKEWSDNSKEDRQRR